MVGSETLRGTTPAIIDAILPRLLRPGVAHRLSLPAQQQHDIAEVELQLANRHWNLVATTCPCGQSAGADAVAATERYGLALRTVCCRHCGTLRFDPYLDAAALSAFYSNHYQRMYARAEQLDAYWQRQQSYGRRIWQVCGSRLKPGDAVLELGCGAGGALDVFRQHQMQAEGADYDERLLQHARGKGLVVRSLGTAAAAAAHPQSSAARYALVYLHHVFEHVADPMALLAELRGQLAAGGQILCVVPDVYRIDRSAPANGDLLRMLHIAHFANYSRSGLRWLGHALGLSVHFLKAPVVAGLQPELWTSFRLLGSAAAAPEPFHGGLPWLQRNEVRFLAGRTAAQRINRMRGRLSRLRSRALRWLGR